MMECWAERSSEKRIGPIYGFMPIIPILHHSNIPTGNPCALCLFLLGHQIQLLKQPICVSQDIISLFLTCILDAAATQATAGTNEQFKADGVEVQIYSEEEGLTVGVIKLSSF